MLQPAEAAFDAVALFVELFIVLALLLPAPAGGDDRFGLHRFDMGQDAVAVIAFVGDDGFGLTLSEQFHRLRAVIDLSGGDAEVDRLSILIGEQVNFGRQTSSGTPQSLVCAPFLRPVAACWWARTIVESIIRYWFFRSFTSSAKIRSQTPE